jgi:hypothetical protein
VDICKAVSLLPQSQPFETKQQLNDEAEEFVRRVSQIVEEPIGDGS